MIWLLRPLLSLIPAKSLAGVALLVVGLEAVGIPVVAPVVDALWNIAEDLFVQQVF